MDVIPARLGQHGSDHDAVEFDIVGDKNGDLAILRAATGLGQGKWIRQGGLLASRKLGRLN
jgi:hypothetical protein